MYKKDELVMYGGMGVCRIVDIGKPSFVDESDHNEYYFLEPVFKSGNFYVPIDSEKTLLRKILTKKAAKGLIDSIPTIKPDVFTTNSVQQLAQHYQALIDNHKEEDLLLLIKSVTVKEAECQKNNKKLGQIDKRFIKKAQELLYGELAAVLGVDIETIEKMVEEKM